MFCLIEFSNTPAGRDLACQLSQSPSGTIFDTACRIKLDGHRGLWWFKQGRVADILRQLPNDKDSIARLTCPQLGYTPDSPEWLWDDVFILDLLSAPLLND